MRDDIWGGLVSSAKKRSLLLTPAKKTKYRRWVAKFSAEYDADCPSGAGGGGGDGDGDDDDDASQDADLCLASARQLVAGPVHRIALRLPWRATAAATAALEADAALTALGVLLRRQA